MRKWIKLVESIENEGLTAEDFAWFGDSKIVDDVGKPLVLYHGTAGDFSVFVPSETGAYGPGIYLTPYRREAEKWAGIKGGSKIICVIASIVNPYCWTDNDAHLHPSIVGKKVRKSGYDGIIQKWMDGSMEIVAFSGDQVRVIG